MTAFVVTYPANRDSLALTLADFRATDWGADPVVIDQPAEWPAGGDSAPANYKRALEAAAADGCDFALLMEDDTRYARAVRKNLLACPLVAEDRCDYFSLFMPDLVADPWDRTEPHLGYRVAKPRYGGPDRLWEKYRVWGVQAVLLSRRLVLAALARWDRYPGVQDARLLGVCGELEVPLYYAAPCWADHAPVRSGYGTPAAYAPDFDPGFRLDIEPGFRPPDGIPGWLTRAEGETLWRAAAGRDVLEIGAGCGQRTVCLAQSARKVTTVEETDPGEATEWARRFGVADRVRSVGDLGPDERFGLVVVGSRDAAGLEHDVAAALGVLTPGGVLAVHHYPDPAWPDVRRVVDARGWTRVKQTDYLALFRT